MAEVITNNTIDRVSIDEFITLLPLPSCLPATLIINNNFQLGKTVYQALYDKLAQCNKTSCRYIVERNCSSFEQTYSTICAHQGELNQQQIQHVLPHLVQWLIPDLSYIVLDYYSDKIRVDQVYEESIGKEMDSRIKQSNQEAGVRDLLCLFVPQLEITQDHTRYCLLDPAFEIGHQGRVRLFLGATFTYNCGLHGTYRGYVQYLIFCLNPSKNHPLADCDATMLAECISREFNEFQTQRYGVKRVLDVNKFQVHYDTCLDESSPLLVNIVTMQSFVLQWNTASF